MSGTAYLYEFVGFAYYVMFVMMGGRRFRDRFTARSRALTLLAAIVLVGNVPGHYGNAPLGVAMMFAFAVAALVSSAIDARRG